MMVVMMMMAHLKEEFRCMMKTLTSLPLMVFLTSFVFA